MTRTQSKLHSEVNEIMKGNAPFHSMFLDFVSLLFNCFRQRDSCLFAQARHRRR